MNPTIPMQALRVNPDLTANPWTDLKDIPLTKGNLMRIGRVPKATTFGASAVALIVDTGYGPPIVATVTMKLLGNAIRIFQEKDALLRAEQSPLGSE